MWLATAFAVASAVAGAITNAIASALALPGTKWQRLHWDLPRVFALNGFGEQAGRVCNIALMQTKLTTH
jgi:hypothetical protein